MNNDPIEQKDTIEALSEEPATDQPPTEEDLGIFSPFDTPKADPSAKPEPEPEAPYVDKGSYFVYGLAIGLVVGMVLFFLFNQNRWLLTAAFLLGGTIGAMKKKK